MQEHVVFHEPNKIRLKQLGCQKILHTGMLKMFTNKVVWGGMFVGQTLSLPFLRAGFRIASNILSRHKKLSDR